MELPTAELNAAVDRIRIGTPTLGDSRFVGSIRELRIYSRALTIVEIDDVMEAENELTEVFDEESVLLERFECNGTLSGLTADTGAAYAEDADGPFTP